MKHYILFFVNVALSVLCVLAGLLFLRDGNVVLGVLCIGLGLIPPDLPRSR